MNASTPPGLPPLPSPHFTAIGGARFGTLNATVPFGYLSATAEGLTVKIWGLAKADFSPDQVVAMEPQQTRLGVGQGLCIVHIRRDLPQKIIFWATAGVENALDRIRATGFQPAAARADIPVRPGFAMRWSILLPLLALSYAPFVVALARRGGLPRQPPPGTRWMLLFLLGSSLATLYSPLVQRLVLKPGRDVGEVQPVLRLVIFVATLLLIIFSVLIASGAFPGIEHAR